MVRYILAAVLGLCAAPGLLSHATADEADPMMAFVRNALTQIREGDGDAAYEATLAVARARADVVRELIVALRDAKTDRERVAICRLLGCYRAPEAAYDLAGLITLEAEADASGFRLEPPPFGWMTHPAEEALTKIGPHCFTHMVHNLAVSDDEETRRRSAEVIWLVLGVCCRRMLDGMEFAPAVMAGYIEQEEDPQKKQRLQDSLVYFEWPPRRGNRARPPAEDAQTQEKVAPQAALEEVAPDPVPSPLEQIESRVTGELGCRTEGWGAVACANLQGPAPEDDDLAAEALSVHVKLTAMLAEPDLDPWDEALARKLLTVLGVRWGRWKTAELAASKLPYYEALARAAGGPEQALALLLKETEGRSGNTAWTEARAIAEEAGNMHEGLCDVWPARLRAVEATDEAYLHSEIDAEAAVQRLTDFLQGDVPEPLEQHFYFRLARVHQMLNSDLLAAQTFEKAIGAGADPMRANMHRLCCLAILATRTREREEQQEWLRQAENLYEWAAASPEAQTDKYRLLMAFNRSRLNMLQDVINPPAPMP